MNLVDIEYHKPCTHYDDGYHRKRSGWYTCECGASSAWHTTTPVEPDADFPTRDQARGLLILRGVTVDGNADARAIIQAYIDGELVRR